MLECERIEFEGNYEKVCVNIAVQYSNIMSDSDHKAC